MGLRAELADHLRAELPKGISVYAAGVDLIATPAVVINPADPYQVPSTLGRNRHIETFLHLVIVSNRSDPAAALAQLEDHRWLVSEALVSFVPRGQWLAFGQWQQTDIGGTQYAAATLDVMIIDTDRGATIP